MKPFVEHNHSISVGSNSPRRSLSEYLEVTEWKFGAFESTDVVLEEMLGTKASR